MFFDTVYTAWKSYWIKDFCYLYRGDHVKILDRKHKMRSSCSCLRPTVLENPWKLRKRSVWRFWTVHGPHVWKQKRKPLLIVILFRQKGPYRLTSQEDSSQRYWAQICKRSFTNIFGTWFWKNRGFFILIRNILRFHALDCPFQDGQRLISLILD